MRSSTLMILYGIPKKKVNILLMNVIAKGAHVFPLVALTLLHPDQSQSRMEAGTIFLYLHTTDLFTRAATYVDACVIQSNQLTDGSELYHSVGRLLEKVETMSKFIDDISEVCRHFPDRAVDLLVMNKIHPYAKLAWSLVSALYKVPHLYPTSNCAHPRRVGRIKPISD